MAVDDVALVKIGDLRLRLDRIRSRLAVLGPAAAADDPMFESLVLNVLLGVQDAVDLGAHVIAREGWEPPENLGATFGVLERRGVLTAATAEAMRRGTRLRNLIAHGYTRVVPGRLVDSARAGLAEFEAFLEEVCRWLQRPASAER